MPVYEYRCQSGHEFELRRGMSDIDSPAACPQCGKNGKRMTSVFASQNTGVGIMVPTKQAFRPTTGVKPASKAQPAKAVAVAKAKPVKAPAVVKKAAKPKAAVATKGKAPAKGKR